MASNDPGSLPPPDEPSVSPQNLHQEPDDLQQPHLDDAAGETPMDDDDVPICVICLEDMRIRDECELVPCRHRRFDYHCISKWLDVAPLPKCPLCKKMVAEIRSLEHGGPLRVFRHSLMPDALVRSNVNATLPTATHPGSSLLPQSRLNRGRLRPPHRRPDAGRRSQLDTQRGADEMDVWNLDRRREVYRNYSFSLHIGGNGHNRWNEITPASFEADQTLISRARNWIRRELRVFSFLSLDDTDTVIPTVNYHSPGGVLQQRRASNAEFLLEYIIAILKSVDIMGSTGQAFDMLADFLGRDHARLFLHELRCYLRSPYTLIEWDSSVQYNRQVRQREESPPKSAGPSRGETGESSRGRGGIEPSRGRGRGEGSSSRGLIEPSPGRDSGPSRRDDFPRPHRSGRVEKRTPSRGSMMRGFNSRPLDDRSRAFWGLGR